MKKPVLYNDGGRYFDGRYRYLGYSIHLIKLIVKDSDVPPAVSHLETFWHEVGYNAELHRDGILVARISDRHNHGSASIRWLDGGEYMRFVDTSAAWARLFEWRGQMSERGTLPPAFEVPIGINEDEVRPAPAEWLIDNQTPHPLASPRPHHPARFMGFLLERAVRSDVLTRIADYRFIDSFEL